MKQSLSFLATIAITGALECFLPLDVMFLQDTTGSLEAIIGKMVTQIPLVYAGISSRFPDTYFGVAEFQDKPYWPLGEPDGFCYKLDAPLTDDMAAVIEAYSYLYASGGGDTPEAQYQAIINTALDPAIGWRPRYDMRTANVSGAATGGRIIVMATDSVPHLNGDMAKFVDYPDVPQGLPPNSGMISTDDITYECLYQEYPSPDQLKAALKNTNTSLIILTPDDAAIIPAWTWVNSDLLQQPSAFYHRVKSDEQPLYEVLVELLQVFSYSVPCATTTTTIKPGETTTTPNPGETTTGPTSAVSTSVVPPECQECPCVSPTPCDMCRPECEAAVLIRLRQEPKKLQVIVNNE